MAANIMLKLQLLLQAVAILDHFFVIYFLFFLNFLCCLSFPLPAASGFQYPMSVWPCCVCVFYLPPPTGSETDCSFSLVILMSFPWVVDFYFPCPPSSPHTALQNFFLIWTRKTRKQKCTVHYQHWQFWNSDWGQSEGETGHQLLQSQQIRADDGCSSWREVIMFSTSIASAQLSLQFGTFCFSWDMQTWSQIIPLHHLKVPKLFGRLIMLFIIHLQISTQYFL